MQFGRRSREGQCHIEHENTSGKDCEINNMEALKKMESSRKRMCHSITVGITRIASAHFRLCGNCYFRLQTLGACPGLDLGRK